MKDRFHLIKYLFICLNFERFELLRQIKAVIFASPATQHSHAQNLPVVVVVFADWMTQCMHDMLNSRQQFVLLLVHAHSIAQSKKKKMIYFRKYLQDLFRYEREILCEKFRIIHTFFIGILIAFFDDFTTLCFLTISVAVVHKQKFRKCSYLTKLLLYFAIFKAFADRIHRNDGSLL